MEDILNTIEGPSPAEEKKAAYGTVQEWFKSGNKDGVTAFSRRLDGMMTAFKRDMDVEEL